jgi:hypothetical protein
MIEKVRFVVRRLQDGNRALQTVVAGATVTHVLAFLLDAEEDVALMSAAALTVFGFVYFGRWITHLVYYVSQRKCTARLRALVVVELVVWLGWQAGAFYVLRVASAALAVLLSAVLFFVVAWLASAVADAAEGARLESASFRVEQSGAGQALEMACLRHGVDELMDLLGEAFGKGRSSLLIVVTLIALATTGLANAPAGALEFKKEMRKIHELVQPHHERRVVKGSTPPPKARKPKAPKSKRLVQPRPQVTTPLPTPAPAKPPTYEQLCGPEPTGMPAPQPQASALRGVFLAAGQPASGCAGRPSPVSGRNGTWTMAGYCDGRLYSLAVTTANGNAALLIGTQPARIALEFAASHTLIGVSERIPLRSGDAYVLRTTNGREIIVRRHSSSEESSGAQSCDQVTGEAPLYSLLPPALGARWLGLAGKEFVWPLQSPPGHGTAYRFETDRTPPTLAATGSCTGRECSIGLIGGGRLPRPVRITEANIRALNR